MRHAGGLSILVGRMGSSRLRALRGPARKFTPTLLKARF